jgi:hypothetical protein
MKRISLLLFLFLWSNALWAAKDRLVELSWEPITGAVSYEIEIYKIKDDKKTLLGKESTYSFTWRKKLTSGQYAYRLRSLDYRRVPGPWSAHQEFFVNLPSVSLIRPYENESIEGIEGRTVEILFAWEEVVGARYYLLHILDAKGNDVYKNYISETKTYVNLKTAKVYNWRVEAVRSKSDPIPAPSNTRELDIKGPSLKPTKITLNRSSKKYLTFKWTKPEGAKHFAYHLYQSKSGTWVKIKSDANYKKTVYRARKKRLKPDRYRFIVDVLAPGRSASKRSVLEFDWSGVKVAKEEKKLEDPVFASTTGQVVKTVRSPFEAFFSFGAPGGNYEGYVDETESLVTNKISAQRFVLGLNYNVPNKNRRYYFAGEMDNFVNSKAAWQLYTGDFGIDWFWGSNHHFEVGTGLFFKQTPYIWGDVLLGNSSTENRSISTIGANAVIKYRWQFIESWFVEMHGLLRYHLMGLSLQGVGGETLNPSMENLIFFKVIYRYGQLIDFIIGYESNIFNITYSGTLKDNTLNGGLAGLHAGVTIPF